MVVNGCVYAGERRNSRFEFVLWNSRSHPHSYPPDQTVVVLAVEEGDGPAVVHGEGEGEWGMFAPESQTG